MAPIKVRTSDEVADVADTLNVVQAAALELAVDQAAAPQRGRRAVNWPAATRTRFRQLDFITELERNETRTATLGTCSASTTTPPACVATLSRCWCWRAWKHPASGAIRSAWWTSYAPVGEVEDYHRVTITTMDTAMVVGLVASDLAHLTAELIENALRFSAPDRR